MTAVQLSDGNNDGWVLGQSASDLGAFFGAAPVVQQTAPSAVGTTTVTAIDTSTISTAATSTTPFGFATSTQANNLMTVINELVASVNIIKTKQDAHITATNLARTALVNLGLVA